MNARKKALEQVASNSYKGDGTWAYSGHAFRITAIHGLD